MTGIILAGLGGLVLGSFANVVIHRVPRNESIVRPGSRCPHCGAAIRPHDNVPVASWVLLRGRCRGCGHHISVRYPLIELLTGVVFALTAWRVAESTDLIAYLPLAWVLIVLSGIDIDHKLLPNRIVVPAGGAMVGLLGVAAALGPGAGAWVRALAGGAAAFGGFLVMALISPRGMGMGDVKLSAVLGLALAYLGWDHLFIGIFLAFLAGALGGLIVVALRKGGMKTEIPFGPYLAIGTMLAVLWGEPIARAWLRT